MPVRFYENLPEELVQRILESGILLTLKIEFEVPEKAEAIKAKNIQMNLKYKGEQHEKMTNEEIEELLGDMAASRPIKRPLKNIEKGTTCDELHSVFYSWFTSLKVTLPTIFPADYDRHDYQPKFKLYDYVESFDGFEWGPLDLEDKKFADTFNITVVATNLTRNTLTAHLDKQGGKKGSGVNLFKFFTQDTGLLEGLDFKKEPTKFRYVCNLKKTSRNSVYLFTLISCLGKNSDQEFFREPDWKELTRMPPTGLQVR